jgi:hypothetical protein
MRITDTGKKMFFSELGTLAENRKKEIKALEHTIKRLEFKNVVLQEKYDLLLYKRFIRTSDRQDETQPEPFDEVEVETGTRLESRKDTQKPYLWPARGGPPEKPVIIFKL